MKIKVTITVWRTEGGRIVNRIIYKLWQDVPKKYAYQLWQNPEVAKYIHKNGMFSDDEVEDRVFVENQQFDEHGVQYFPIFINEDADEVFIGVAGLRPTTENGVFEFCIHLLPEFWHQGFASEAGQHILNWGFNDLGAQEIRAGHNPNNHASKKMLTRLGFNYVFDQYYAPTGLNHPTYSITFDNYKNN